MIAQSAPAKINLYLHVGGVRRDGLHELASLFAFTQDGDVVIVEASEVLSLRVTGPFASALSAFPLETNLVLIAAQRLRALCGVTAGAAITLEKKLPVAAGIGGGSADAAATLRALIKLWELDISRTRLEALAFDLGADVPACLGASPVNVTGAGERIGAGPCLPPFWITLVNPLVPTPTGPIFRGFDKKFPTAAQPRLQKFKRQGTTQFLDDLHATRNDLEFFAAEKAPVISGVLSFLRSQSGAQIARMSGSGATCFALFAAQSAAVRTARRARAKGWWSMASRLIPR